MFSFGTERVLKSDIYFKEKKSCDNEMYIVIVNLHSFFF